MDEEKDTTGTEELQSGRTKKKPMTVVFLAIVVVALLVAYYLWQGGFGSYLTGANDYQAVFLSNGQVYFGKASGLNSNFVSLRDVYYLQVRQVLQPVQDGDPQTQQQISLAKLGVTELHKPKDEMKINRDHILFIEDIDVDSDVVQAIMEYKDSLKASASDEGSDQ